ncbi:MAG: tRNA pseudouridine synthase A [Terracidiphilus sp.]
MTEPAQSGPRNWRLTLAYDGTEFRGWQVQPGEPTIQGELQTALGRITSEGPLPQGSGRTDAGVHALAQVASFLLHAPIPPENLLRALNRTLPPAIRVTEARHAPAGFHARHSAQAKTYEYRIFREAICPPFLARYVYHWTLPMNFEALEDSARIFEGEHDFQSFAASDLDTAHREVETNSELVESAPTVAGAVIPPGPTARLVEGWAARPAVRTIFSSRWDRRQTEAGEILVYTVRGNGFLHHMVRNLVGTMLDVARGYLRVGDIGGILSARRRSAAGPTAPARGLFLHSVHYPE